MEPVRVRGGGTRTPLVFGALVLAGVVAVGAAPRFFGTGAQPSIGPLPAVSSTPGAASTGPDLLTPPLPAARPSYPAPAVASSVFWIEIRRNGHVLQKVALARQSDDSRTGTLPVPVAWRTRPPIVSLLGRTVPENHPSRLFSIRLALPETPRTGPAVNLAGGLSVIMDPAPAPTGSFDPGPMINYVHTWSYSADLEWTFGGGPQLLVTVAPQLGI